MSEEKMIATRESFGEALANLDNEKVVVLDADLSNATKTDKFAEKYQIIYFVCNESRI